MRNWKKAALACGVLALGLGALGLSRMGSDPAAVYTRQAEAFAAAAQQILETGSTQGITIDGVSRIDYWPGERPVIEFTTGGSGLTPSAAYRGVYYTADGSPAAFQNVDVPLTPDGAGWRWTDGTDNHGTTTPLGGGWFTFEASF